MQHRVKNSEDFGALVWMTSASEKNALYKGIQFLFILLTYCFWCAVCNPPLTMHLKHLWKVLFLENNEKYFSPLRHRCMFRHNEIFLNIEQCSVLGKISLTTEHLFLVY